MPLRHQMGALALSPKGKDIKMVEFGAIRQDDAPWHSLPSVRFRPLRLFAPVLALPWSQALIKDGQPSIPSPVHITWRGKPTNLFQKVYSKVILSRRK